MLPRGGFRCRRLWPNVGEPAHVELVDHLPIELRISGTVVNQHVRGAAAAAQWRDGVRGLVIASCLRVRPTWKDERRDGKFIAQSAIDPTKCERWTQWRPPEAGGLRLD